jgi:hypothetical protein
LYARILISLFEYGEARTLYDTLSAIQAKLLNKKLDDPQIKTALVHVAAELTAKHGLKVASLTLETASILLKVIRNAKDSEFCLRFEAYRGLTQVMKGAGKACSEVILKDILKQAKVGLSDRFYLAQAASIQVIDIERLMYTVVRRIIHSFSFTFVG